MEFSSINTIWTLIAAMLVFFMQAGFTMVETGFTRAKNAGNIIMKNLMDFSLGSIAFWIFGFGLMFAGNGLFIGGLDLFTKGDYSSTIPSAAFIIFQTVFCATASTIVSGAMAERTKFSSYCICSVILSAVIYPISGHWIWGGGWLSQIGFHDFAGSTAVHMLGGVAALVGAKILGPRIGKYSKSGKSKAIPGHSLTLGALGVFILWFCWFGFNGGSTVSMTGNAVKTASNILITTNISAAVATVTVMIITWIRYKKPDVSMTLNGSLAGLVAITAGCDQVSPTGSFFIGLIAGFVVVFGIEFIEKIIKIDDPVGAIGVHGMCGAIGTILVGVFSTQKGILYGGSFKFLGVQIIGVLSVAIWVGITMTIVFKIIEKTIGLRVTKEEEIAGLDIEEHGIINSYADFMPIDTNIKSTNTILKSETIPVVDNSSSDLTMKKIIVITNQAKFEKLKFALDNIGITGMTVTHVLGYGMQKGNMYRGVEVETSLRPKIKIEIVIAKTPVEKIISTIKNALYTGNIGDGKIFIYDIKKVIKVRTGEEDYDALQDE